MSSPMVGGKLVLLDDLRKVEPGTKIRFLGCVVSPFSAKSGRLALRHVVAGRSRDSVELTALVDLGHVGHELPGSETVVGSWLNVLGYVEHTPNDTTVHGASKPVGGEIQIQGISVWSAGSVDVSAYEKAVRARQQGTSVMSLVSSIT